MRAQALILKMILKETQDLPSINTHCARQHVVLSLIMCLIKLSLNITFRTMNAIVCLKLTKTFRELTAKRMLQLFPVRTVVQAQ